MNDSRVTSFLIKQNHPEHKQGPDLKPALDAATKKPSKKGIHIKHKLTKQKGTLSVSQTA